jgi:hypothetical protein
LYCLSFFWPLYCLSFFWPLYCLSFFWPLYCLSFVAFSYAFDIFKRFYVLYNLNDLKSDIYSSHLLGE